LIRRESTHRPLHWSLPARIGCRLGLHSLAWDAKQDGWACSCGRQHPWAERLGRRDDG